ncbi:hypothetical protein ZEAMMB73_Zm00001d029504 [Zea mays]|uniref:DEK-C domain-containing protein n=1 Tax=Zea mays TaxID=4577 RepID=A0A1D6K5M0_MAIZE|nr:hypothetical protein ZEAMMB73_Zm00001d029504 [Zea mays]
MLQPGFSSSNHHHSATPERPSLPATPGAQVLFGPFAGDERHQDASETKLMKQPTWVFFEKESVTDLREQILQLIQHDCKDQEEKSRAELLEKLNRCKRDTLIELCRSFDLIGSRANRKEELVLFLMEFIKDHCSGSDVINSDKKYKKRKRVREEENLSAGKPSKTNFEPSGRINYSVSENLDGASLSEAPIPTDEQAIITTPPTKFVTAAEDDSTDVKALQRKMSSIAKKKTTSKEDCKVKLCGNRESKGDTKPRKQVIKPSKDELREAVFLILDTADFATMTFGDVVKEVDKYFGKDLFERKPLIRSLIEEELFRLADEAEKKELEESEAAEAKARAEQAAKEMAQVQTVELVINEQNVLEDGRDSNTKDSLKNANDSANKKCIDGGASVEYGFNENSCYAAEGSEEHKVDDDNKNITKDGNGGKVAVAPTANTDCTLQLQGSSNVEAETTMKSNVGTLEASKDGEVRDARNGENNGTEDGGNEGIRSGNVGSNAEAEESHGHGNNERAEHTEDDKAQECSHNENSASVGILGDGDGEAREGDINAEAEQSQADGGGNSKAEDAEHNENTKTDANSSKNGTTAAGNGKTDVDVKGATAMAQLKEALCDEMDVDCKGGGVGPRLCRS